MYSQFMMHGQKNITLSPTCFGVFIISLTEIRKGTYNSTITLKIAIFTFLY